MTTLRLPPTVLPDGDRRDRWVVDGVITSAPRDAAEALPGRYALPGLVDAHAHLTLDMSGTGRDTASRARAGRRGRAARGVRLDPLEGAPGVVVTYDADPRDDPEVLRTPAAVVRRGVRVA